MAGMKWLAKDIAVALSHGYLFIDKSTRADHDMLLLLCARNDSSGIIDGCRGWSDGQWRIFTHGVMGLADVEAVVAAGLAAYVPPGVVKALREEDDPECGWIMPADVARLLADQADEGETDRSVDRSIDRSRPFSDALIDRSVIDRCCDRTETDRSVDLVVYHYDLGGQIQSQHVSVTNSKNAIIGAKKRGQRRFPFADAPPRGAPFGRPEDRPIDRSIDRSVSGRSAVAQRPPSTHTLTEEDPPLTPPVGGPVLPVPTDREAAALLEAFWRWFQPYPKPKVLNWDLWGGGKKQCLEALVQRAAIDQRPLPEFLADIKAKLEQCFANPKWVTDMVDRRRHFKSWLRQGDYLAVLPPVAPPPHSSPPMLKLVGRAEPTPTERKRGVLLARLERSDVSDAEKERIRADLELLEHQEAAVPPAVPS